MLDNHNHIYIYIHTLLLFAIAVENGPFIDDIPIKTSIYEGFSMAMLNNQLVTVDINVHVMCIYIYIYISYIYIIRSSFFEL